MRLAVVSDSHLGAPDDRFERVYARHLAGADWLLHCGDITGQALYHRLCLHPHVCCVRGNCDGFPAGADLPITRELELPLAGGGVLRVGLAHGWGERSTVWQRVAGIFPGCGLVCYGHTHRRDWTERGTQRLLNPGSLAEGSLALVDVAPDGSLSCRFVDVDAEDSDANPA